MGSPIILLGMPQSGVTEVAGALSTLGFFFGSEGEFFKLDQDDRDGRFEQRALTNFNYRCLSAFQMHVASVNSLPAAWRSYPHAKGLHHELKDLLSATFVNRDLCGIKQPMATLLTPLYQDVFAELGLASHFVVCVRSPLGLPATPMKWTHEVGSRPIPPLGPLALGCWLRHTLGGIEAAKDSDLSVVTFEEFMEHPRSFLEGILRFHPACSPTEDQWSQAIAGLKSQLPIDSHASDPFEDYPSLLRKTLNLCKELGRGQANHDEVVNLVEQFRLWREMLAPPANPGAQVSLSWVERGVAKVEQTPFLPSGDWQTVRLPVGAPPNTFLSGLFYSRPCRIWLRRCVWSSNGKYESAKLVAGPGSRLSETEGIQRLDGACESQQVSLRSPSAPGPFTLELELLLEAGAQIYVEAANRLADRLLQCTAVHAALLTASRPPKKGDQ